MDESDINHPSYIAIETKIWLIVSFKIKNFSNKDLI